MIDVSRNKPVWMVKKRPLQTVQQALGSAEVPVTNRRRIWSPYFFWSLSPARLLQGNWRSLVALPPTERTDSGDRVSCSGSLLSDR
jgi:hypothetical protein